MAPQLGEENYRPAQYWFGLCALLTLKTCVEMTIDPKRAWGGFLVREDDMFVSLIYASAMFGEFALQGFASLRPRQGLVGAVTFMLPYKLVSAMVLFHAGLTSRVPGRERECYQIAMFWFVPFVATIMALSMSKGAWTSVWTAWGFTTLAKKDL